jgi:hypothetical protein
MRRTIENTFPEENMHKAEINSVLEIKYLTLKGYSMEEQSP